MGVDRVSEVGARLLLGVWEMFYGTGRSQE